MVHQVSNRLPIKVRLESFEGPLDLLLFLIQSHELDISKVSITTITDQYLAYIKLMQELNFDMASEFLVMAATLLHWKSKSLLPQENGGKMDGAVDDMDILTPEMLMEQLRQHQIFKAAGENLARRPWLGIEVFARENPKPPVEKIWKTMNVTGLALSYQDILGRERKRKTILKKETVSITGKIKHFADRLKMGELTELRHLLTEGGERAEMVVTFLASLELSRLKKLRLFQEGAYLPIFIELIDSLNEVMNEFSSEFEIRMHGVEEKVEAEIKNEEQIAALEENTL